MTNYDYTKFDGNLIINKQRIKYFVHSLKYKNIDLDINCKFDFNITVHTELIGFNYIYKRFIKILKKFNDRFSARPICCIVTPYSPLGNEQIIKNKISVKEYTNRVLEISKYADIGYHGHFYMKNEYDNMRENNYSLEVIKKQMSDEVNYISDILYKPKYYVAGTWFINNEVLNVVDDLGIEFDFSLRNKPNSSGEFLKFDGFDRGDKILYPNLNNLKGIQSIFYITKHIKFYKEYYQKFLSNKKEKQYFVIPAHENDLISFENAVFNHIDYLVRENGNLSNFMN